MKKEIFSLLFCIFGFQILCAQVGGTRLDLDVEKNTGNPELSAGWKKLTSSYIITKDSIEKHSGKYSVSIQSKKEDENQAGVVALHFPADYTGKTITLSGYLKTLNVSDGRAGLFLRIDGERTVLGANSMQKEALKGTKDWALYSVKLPLPQNAKTIYVGAGLWGTGQIWVDDLKVSIDGKDLDKAKKKEKSPAEKDTTFNKGSAISISDLTPGMINHLSILGRVWGFLKYHHPAIATGNYNWDYELFRIMPKVLEAKDPSERNVQLLKWVNGLGTFKTGKNTVTVLDKVKQAPDLEWINSELLGNELARLLLMVKDAEKPKKHQNYYVGILDYVPVPEFRNESPYSQFSFPDTGFRLLSLFRYWNIINYYFPYKYLIEENWNTILEEYIPRYIEATSELDYKKAVLSMVSRIHDSHAYVYDASFTLNKAIGLRYPAIEIGFIEDKAVVTGFLDDELEKQSGMHKGDVITSINAVPTDSLVKSRLPYVSASNHITKLRNLSMELLKSNDSIIHIGYLRNDTIAGQNPIKTFTQNEVNIYKKAKPTDTALKILANNVAYFQVKYSKVSDLPNIMERVSETDALIVDLRAYPKESIIQKMGEYLFEAPTEFAKFSLLNADQPGLFTFGETLKIGKINPDYYKGRIIILINENTQSNAEFTAMGFRFAKNAMIIGSQTAGADGNVIPMFSLPGEILTTFTGLGVYYPDGGETQRIGIVPDIEIKPTIKGIREGRDEVLEKALELISNNNSLAISFCNESGDNCIFNP